MRNLILCLFVGILSFSFLFADAEAKRFGGGKSFGVSRQSSSFSRSNINNTAKPQSTAATAAKPASGMSKWLGPLAGLAIGGMLASLFMGHGFGTGILSWLLIGALIFFAWRFIRSRLQPATQTPQNMNYQAQQAHSVQQPQPTFAALRSESINKEQDREFDEKEFLRHAKSLFIRLQAAYDSKNLVDIREFTSPEIFAEIQLQLQERGEALNQTDVVSIDAELLDVTYEQYMTIATVQFSGMVREEQNAELVAIKELWHFQKFEVKPAWVVAGIQQA